MWADLAALVRPPGLGCGHEGKMESSHGVSSGLGLPPEHPGARSASDFPSVLPVTSFIYFSLTKLQGISLASDQTIHH